MADPLYDRLLATANRLIDQYGKPAVIRRNTVSGPEYDPDLTPTDNDIIYVELEEALVPRDSSLVLQDDIFGIISMSGDVSVIELPDLLVVGAKVYTMISLNPLNPGGVQLFTEFQAR